MAKIAIQGFVRMGPSPLKAALKAALFTPASISDIKDVKTLAALFEADSNYGRWHEPVKTNDKGFVIGGGRVPYFHTRQARPHLSKTRVRTGIASDPTGPTRPRTPAHYVP